MARIKITKRVKLSADNALQSQVVSSTEPTTPVSSITVTGSANPVSLTLPELFDYLVDTIQTRIRLHDAHVSVCQDSPGKRKQDSTDDPVHKLDVISGTNRDTSVARASSPYGILANQDASTLETKSDLDDDNAIRQEETALMEYFDQDIRRQEEREHEEEAMAQQTHVLKTL